MHAHILMIEDDDSTRRSFTRYFQNTGYDIDGASTLRDARARLSEKSYDVVLLDLKLPDGLGIEWIPGLRKKHPEMAVVVITGTGGVESAVDAMKRGADNYLTKPVDLDKLDVLLKKSLELENLRRRTAVFKRLEKKEQPYFGHTPRTQMMLEHALLAAENGSAVLLLGETGTGKGVLARWIHERSARQNADYVEVNCSALKGDLLGSELFGHAKGAFTSAIRDREGLIGIADNGTLFLDEIGDMDPVVQAQLLKAIEEKTYRRLGENKIRHSDFRLICATHHDLAKEVRKGRFREDLFYRLNVFPITLPPLREQPETLPGIAGHLLSVLGAPFTQVQPDVLLMLQEYHWPGNIRELKNMLERAFLLSRGESLKPSHFPGLESEFMQPEAAESTLNLAKTEKDRLLAALSASGNDTLKTSRVLGISRPALYRRMKKYKIGKYRD